MAVFDQDLIKKVLSHAHAISIPNGLTASAVNNIIRERCELVGIEFIPTFGVSNSYNSNLNILADAQYTFIRHFNSGSRNYQASDLFFYYMGGISLYLFIAYCYKILGILNLYSYNHRNLPELLARHMHINLQDFQANQEDFRKWLKTKVHQMASYVLPSELTILQEWMSKTLVLYLDDFNESSTPQFYSFNPLGFYKLDWDNVKMELNTDIIDADDPITFAFLRNYWDSMLEDYINSDDIGTISGDILKAYKNDVYVMQDIADDFVLPIKRTTNEEMTYILNMDVIYPYSSIEDGEDLSAWAYTQDGSGIIQFNPSCAVAIADVHLSEGWDTTDLEVKQMLRVATKMVENLHSEETLLSMLSSVPSDEEMFSGITSKVAYDVTNAATEWADAGPGLGLYTPLINTGTEVIVSVSFYGADEYSDNAMRTSHYASYCFFDTSDADQVQTLYEFMCGRLIDIPKETRIDQFANGPKLTSLTAIVACESGQVTKINNYYNDIQAYTAAITSGTMSVFSGFKSSHIVYNDLIISNTSLRYALNLLEFYALTQNLWFKRNK